MAEDRSTSKERLVSTALLTAMASGLTAVALGGAGTANASCASITGFSSGINCEGAATSFAVNPVDDSPTPNASGLFTSTVNTGSIPTSGSPGFVSVGLPGGENTQAAPAPVQDVEAVEEESAAPEDIDVTTQTVGAFDIESPDESEAAAPGTPLLEDDVLPSNDVAATAQNKFSVSGAIRKGLNFAKSVVAGLRDAVNGG